MLLDASGLALVGLGDISEDQGGFKMKFLGVLDSFEGLPLLSSPL